MNEDAIRKVILYLDESLFEPGRMWPDHIFEERSYSRWAANEIIRRLMDCPFDAPIEIVEAFMLTMIMHTYTVRDPRKKRIFSIARDTAFNILQLL